MHPLCCGTLHQGADAETLPWLAAGQSPAQGLGHGQETASVLHSQRALKGEKEEGEEWKRQRMLREPNVPWGLSTNALPMLGGVSCGHPLQSPLVSRSFPISLTS